MSIITDMIISAILKKGVMSDIKAFETNVEIPNDDARKKPIVINIKAENIQIRLMSGEDKEV